MNFSQVVAEVARISKRPDKLLDIQRMVNEAINFCCVEGNFARDLIEDSYPISSSEYSQSLPLSTFLRFRKIQYIRPSNKTKYLDPLSADKIFARSSECDARDKYYIAGDNLTFNLSALAGALIIGHFTYPSQLDDISPNFWLLDVSPYMVLNKAAATLFASIGDDKSATYHANLFASAFVSAVRDYKYGTNYG